jgi:pyruvate dehydrogenase E1 component alpha subunit
MPKTITSSQLKDMYYRMFLGRTFEEQVYFMFLKGTLPGTVHQSHGQEAVAVGVCSQLNQDDYIVAHHRPHNIALAKGVDPKSAMAELFAKKAGCCKGKGGSMHLGDFNVGMIPSIAIVGASLTLAPGMALAYKLAGTKQVSVAFFGDGGSNEGAFHEGINFAAVRKLPVIFVCENNLYGASTPYDQVSLVTDIADRSCSYGIPGEVVDGMDVAAVYEAAGRAVARARRGDGPTLMECKTYRFCGHSRSDPGHYRDKKELEEWKKRDPIQALRSRILKDKQAKESELTSLEEKAKKVIEEAIAFAQNEPPIELEEALTDVFA